MTVSHPAGNYSRTPWAFIMFAFTTCVTLALLATAPGNPMLAGTIFILGLAVALGWSIYRYPRGKKEPAYSDIAVMDGLSVTPNLITLRLHTERIITNETIPHADTFHRELWFLHGETLLGREQETSVWARLYGTNYVTAKPLPVSGSAVHQQRNITAIGNAPQITIMDVNAYCLPDTQSGIALAATTVFTAPVSTNKTVYFAPKGIPTSRSNKLSTGLIGERAVDRKYNLRSDDIEWARLLFTPDVLQILLDNPTVSVTVKNGVLAVTKHDSWLSSSRYQKVTDMISQIAHNMLTADIYLKENEHRDPS